MLRSMRSLDFNTRTQVTRYGPAVPSTLLHPSATPSPWWPWVLPLPRALCREGNRGQGEPCPAGPTLCSGTQTKGTAADQWVERGEGRWPQQGLRTRAVTWGSAAGRLRHPGLWGLGPPDPTGRWGGEGGWEGLGAGAVTRPGSVHCREAINRLYEAVPGVKGIWKKKVSFNSACPSLGQAKAVGQGIGGACSVCGPGASWGIPPFPHSLHKAWSWWSSLPPPSSPLSGSQQSPVLHPGQEQPALCWHEHRCQHLC